MAEAARTPRKQPRQERARATYDAIVEAAAHIIAARGLAAFNTNAVAERAGVSIGSLYQYFPNKYALMAALIERQQAGQAAALEAAHVALTAGPLEDAVRALVRAAMAHHWADPVLATALDHEEALSSDPSAAMEGGGAVIRRMIAARPDALGHLDPECAARTLPALVRAVVDAWANLDPPQLEKAGEEAVRAVLGYISCE